MKMKKLLVTLLALVFILGTVSTGFAAPLSDVEGTDYEDAVTRLVALGIISGYPDGEFKPDKPVTRAEFAKIIVTALGVGQAAEYAKGATKFSDVPADHWAAGYINVATDMGVINGYPDGTFKPSKEVSYAEAITMIVRALGYEPKAKALGGYPGGYLAIAAEKDITDGVNVVNTLAANRGDIALMVDNALDVPMMEQKTWGQYPEFEENPDKTLLTDKLDVDKVEGRVIEISKVNDDLDADEIKIEITEINDDDSDAGSKKVYTLLAGSPNELFGLEVEAWVNDDDEVIFVDITTDEDDIIYDTITAKNTTNKTVDLDEEDDTFDVADGAYLYEDNSKTTLSNLNTNVYGKIIMDDNDVVFADLYGWDKAGLVVTEVDTDDEFIKYFTTSDKEQKLRLDDADELTIVKDGKEIELGDIEKDDVIYVADLGSDEYYILVVSEKVEGELERVNAGGDEFEIDGKEYDGSGDYLTFSVDNNDNIGTSFDDDLLGEDVVALLDLYGDVRHIVADVEDETSEMYAIAIKKWSTDKDYLKLFTEKGEIVTYEVDEDDGSADYSTLATLDDSSNDVDIVEIEIDEDGVITAIDVKATVDNTPANNNVAANKVSDTDDDYIEINSVKYYVEDDVIIFNMDSDELGATDNYDAFDTDDLDIISWDEIKDKDDVTSLYVIASPDSKNLVEVAVIVKGLGTVGDDEVYYGAVTDKFKNADGDWVLEFKDGTEKVAEADVSAIEIGDLVEYELNKDDEIDTITQRLDDSNMTVANVVYVLDVDGDFIKIDADGTDGGEVWYKVASDAVILDMSSFDTTDGNEDVDEMKEADLADLTDLDYANPSDASALSELDKVWIYVDTDNVIQGLYIQAFGQ